MLIFVWFSVFNRKSVLKTINDIDIINHVYEMIGSDFLRENNGWNYVLFVIGGIPADDSAVIE